MKKILSLALVAMLSLAGSAYADNATSSPQTALYAEDVPNPLPVGAYELSVTVKDGTPSKVLIKTRKPLKHFKLVAIEYVPNTNPEDSTLRFKKTGILHALPVLDPDKPLYAVIPIFGSIPNIGLSYTEEDGTNPIFALSISGEDGSWILHHVTVTEQ